ncbi:hypothetical protein FIBSPDRAFT_886400 [Athelia psychrophila]|uniref:Uncharacterized protein n=1 Tax=Athelia psychrophila TaxID=1759441 RepID=A0A166QSY5_9AGAM|nr:hypothetical protein FIBSPDRAFT_886400 [Fibularhizoctonia sp. CBS 109695]
MNVYARYKSGPLREVAMHGIGDRDAWALELSEGHANFRKLKSFLKDVRVEVYIPANSSDVSMGSCDTSSDTIYLRPIADRVLTLQHWASVMDRYFFHSITVHMMTCLRKYQENSYYQNARTPEGLGLKKIESRPEVGAIQFSPAGCNSSVQERFRINHARMSRFKGLWRNPDFQAYAPGKMVALGSRQPSGGRKGDTYTEYPEISATTMQDIDALFSYAHNAETLDSLLLGFAPVERREFREMSAKSGGNTLGTTIANLYVCNDYAAPQHYNEDEELSMCIQVGKKRCRPSEFNFAYTQWGVYVVTEDWAIWVFNSTHLHGIIVPQVAAAGGKGDGRDGHEATRSQGQHKTAPHKTANRARGHKAVRASYNNHVVRWDGTIELRGADGGEVWAKETLRDGRHVFIVGQGSPSEKECKAHMSRGRKREEPVAIGDVRRVSCISEPAVSAESGRCCMKLRGMVLGGPGVVVREGFWKSDTFLERGGGIFKDMVGDNVGESQAVPVLRRDDVTGTEGMSSEELCDPGDCIGGTQGRRSHGCQTAVPDGNLPCPPCGYGDGVWRSMSAGFGEGGGSGDIGLIWRFRTRKKGVLEQGWMILLGARRHGQAGAERRRDLVQAGVSSRIPIVLACCSSPENLPPKSDGEPDHTEWVMERVCAEETLREDGHVGTEII